MKPSVVYGAMPVRFRAYATGEWEMDLTGPWGTAIYIPNRDGEYVDAVVWADDDENRWWTRFLSVAVLGRENAELAAIGGWPLTVYRTPKAWLLSGGRGVCVLNWDANIRPALAGVERLIVDTPELALKLNQSLGRAPASTIRPVEAIRAA